MHLLAFSFWSTFVLLIALFVPFCTANTECVWATGLVKCNKNQSKVLGAVVELWELDSPQNTNFQNPLDSDDKAAFAQVDDPSGLWKLEGCASDRDWFSINRPEFYLRVYHQCNVDMGEWLTVWPVFRVFTPRTYDWHIEHPIVLDAPVPTAPMAGIVLNNTETSLTPVDAASGGGAIGQQLSFTTTEKSLPFPTISLPYNNVHSNESAAIDEAIVSDGTGRSDVR